jgi:hypothetical protein
MAEDLYCDICDRDASDQVIIARWRDLHVCTDCLEHRAEMCRHGYVDDDVI